jgi:hypothetical protein
MTNWNEHSLRVLVEIPHVDDHLTVSVSSSLDQGPFNEAFGIDNVTVYLYSSDVRVEPSQVTFSTTNWHLPQLLVVHAVDDAVDEDVEVHSISHLTNSEDANYGSGGSNVRSPAGTTKTFVATEQYIASIRSFVDDNDSASIVVSESLLSPEYGLHLSSQPTSSVTVTLAATSDVATSISELTFSNVDWFVPRQVTLLNVSNGGSCGGESTTITGLIGAEDDALNTTLQDDNPHDIGISIIPVSHEVQSDDERYRGKNASFHPTRFNIFESHAVDIHGSGVLQLSSCSYTVREDAGEIIVAIERIAGAQGTLSARLKTSGGTAESNVDFSAIDTFVEFEEGETTKDVHIAIENDTLFESTDEQFYVELTNEAGSGSLGRISANVTIVDDEDAGVLSFTSTTYEASESSGLVAVTVTRTHGASGSLYAEYSTTDGTAVAPMDYHAKVGELFFENDVTEHVIEIIVYNDSYIESPNEEFKITLRNVLQYDLYGQGGESGHLQNGISSVLVLDDGDLHFDSLRPQARRVEEWATQGFAHVRNARDRASSGTEEED